MRFVRDSDDVFIPITGDGQSNNLRGNSSDNLMVGQKGNDRLDGRRGNDFLQGDQGEIHSSVVEVMMICLEARGGIVY